LKDSIKLATLLIGNGADMNFKSSRSNSDSVIYRAINNGNPDIIKLLLSHDTIIKNMHSQIYNQIILKILEGRVGLDIDIINLLIERKADLYVLHYKVNYDDSYEEQNLFCLSLKKDLAVFNALFNAAKDHLDHDNNSISGCIERGKFLQNGPIHIIENKNIPHTNTEWLASHSYTNDNALKGVKRDESEPFEENTDFSTLKSVGINYLLDSFRQTEELQDVLNVMALYSIEHSDFRILFGNIGSEMSSRGHSNYNGNEVAIKAPFALSSARGTLIHELWHYALHEIFQNNAYPYIEGDEVSKKAYEKAMYKCLENLYREMYPTKKLATFDSTHKFCLFIKSELNAFHDHRSKAWEDESANYNKDEHNVGLWSKIKSLFDSLISSAHSLFQEDNNVNMYLSHDTLSLILHSLICYQYDKYYNNMISSEHVEFVVRYEDRVAAGYDPEQLNLLQPLKAYIDIYVKPAMREYVDTHPSRHLLINHNDAYSNSNKDVANYTSESHFDGFCAVWPQEMELILI